MPSDNNKANISAGKPKIGGAIYRAPGGTTPPTTATATLSTAFVCVGYISDAGVVQSENLNTTVVNAWGGEPVLVTENSRIEDFKFTMLETMKDEPNKIVYGDTNVTGDLTNGMTVSASAAELGEHVYVIDQELNGSVKKRTVIPAAVVSAIGDISQVDNNAVGYPVTLTALPDSNSKTHYDYYQAATST